MKEPQWIVKAVSVTDRHRRSCVDSLPNETDLERPLLEPERETSNRQYPQPTRTQSLTSVGCLCVAICCLTIFLFRPESPARCNGPPAQADSPSLARCNDPPARPNWQSLDVEQKNAYIAAVRCMAEKPSKLHSNSTLYDDFTYIHMKNLGLQARSESNLPVFRLYLHLWERNLRSQCSYNGHIPYWDWELDQEAPLKSSIFDPGFGFGGNGEWHLAAPEREETAAAQGCIKDGPFSHLRPQWHSSTPDENPILTMYRSPDCIRRRITERLSSSADGIAFVESVPIRPAQIGPFMQNGKYPSFSANIEKADKSVSKVIGGDFASFAATNDPLFHLHLTNIDRLWWHWQQYHDLTKSNIYWSDLEDPLAFATYPDIDFKIMVREVMDTKSMTMGMCYRY